MKMMNIEQKIYFLQGYLYREAEEAKENGLFPELSVQEIVKLYILETLKEKS